MALPRSYVIRPGDYLTRLAHTFGFDADQVWNDPANAALRALRRSPEVLCPGDVLRIPARERRPLPLRARTRNGYVVELPRVEVKLQLRDATGPLADAAFVVEGEATPRKGRTDSAGAVTLRVPVQTERLLLVLPELARTIPVLVGHLDPEDTAAGLRQRLTHLGYLAEGAGADAVPTATRAFQRKHDLSPTGVADEATLAALRREHGS